MKDSHTGKMRARTIALTAESVAAELVSGSMALIGAELAGLLREHNTKKRLDHLVHLVALAAEAAAAEAAAAEAVSGSIALIAAELVELRECNT